MLFLQAVCGCKPYWYFDLNTKKSCNNRVEIPVGTRKKEFTPRAYMRCVDKRYKLVHLYCMIICDKWIWTFRLICRLIYVWCSPVTPPLLWWMSWTQRMKPQIGNRPFPQMKVACVNVTAVQYQKHQYEIGYNAGFSSNNLHIWTVKVRQKRHVKVSCGK